MIIFCQILLILLLWEKGEVEDSVVPEVVRVHQQEVIVPDLINELKNIAIRNRKSKD